MDIRIASAIVMGLALSLLPVTHAASGLTDEQAAEAAKNYQQYCALCHGKDREGHVNDHAPSLKSKSLLETGYPERAAAVQYGRPGTPMAGFLDEIGGPLSNRQIRQLNHWLNEKEGIPIGRPELPKTIPGDIQLGKQIYSKQCSECHGPNGEGKNGTALGNQAMLSMTSDAFLRHAIVNGRQGTDMQPFGDKLSVEEIDAVTAFLRSRATGWEIRKPVFRKPPSVDDYVINPEGEAPEFEIKDNQYVMSADLYKAMQEKRRMVILDTRAMSLWQLSHNEGSVPLPYYYERGQMAEMAKDLPKDGTWIVIYCECPRAAAEYVNARLIEQGIKNTAVLWEGAFGWVGLGYPVSHGDTTVSKKAALGAQATTGTD